MTDYYRFPRASRDNCLRSADAFQGPHRRPRRVRGWLLLALFLAVFLPAVLA